jgi:hypothetical protein
MAIKLKKTLYIGIGGTGIDAILKSKKCFIDTHGEIPPMIGFLAIDTDNGASNKTLYSKNNELIKLDRSELLICSVQNPLQVYLQNRNEFEWIPSLNVKTIGAISGSGAGQVRSNGRFIARYNHQAISNHIASAIDKINSLIPMESPYVVDLNKDGAVFPIVINIVCSIAGGTGSGMLLDIMTIVHKTLQNAAQKHTIYPWIVMPDIFRSMNAGPAMSNVFYNTYGALRDLDYVMHLAPNNVPLDFGFTAINESPAPIAFLVNNVNTNGTVFDKIDDITDILGRGMFLPSNEMGNAISSPFDNILTNRHVNPNFKIINKQAWVASVGSAELIFDNTEIIKAYSYRVISQICGTLRSYGSGGNNEANLFVDHPIVLIRENEGHDDVINSLLGAPDAPYGINIDVNTSANDINSYINDCVQRLGLEGIKDNFDSKLRTVNTQFDLKIKELLNTPNGIGLTKNFIADLKVIIDLFKNEMISEVKELNDLLSYQIEWSKELTSIRNTGIIILRQPLNQERADLLTNKILQFVKDKRELLRREWAIRFYNTFLDGINRTEIGISNLEVKLKEIEERSRQELLKKQQSASSSSKFQIFLHKEDILNSSENDFNIQIVVLGFIEYLKQINNGISDLIESSGNQIEKHLYEFANSISLVQDFKNLSIVHKLLQLNKEKINQYLQRLLNLAAPLWTFNPQGYLNQKTQIDRLILIGIENGVQSNLCDSFDDLLADNLNQPNFISTHQTDRISVMIVECLLPVFTVNNFHSYENENSLIESKSTISNYIDEKWKARMDREDFLIKPAKQKNNVLESWVQGFIFGYIHFDDNNKVYWTESLLHGSPAKEYRLNLGQLRDEAYDNFKIYKIYKEIDDKLSKKMADEGQLPIQNKLKEIKESRLYNKQYSQLSRNERDQLDQVNFAGIKKLFEEEIDFITKS